MRYAREKSRINPVIWPEEGGNTEMGMTIGRVSLTCKSSVLVMLV